MKHLDVGYTNGVIAAREKYLLKDKLIRLCELSAEDAFRALLDSGFGGGAETTTSVYEYEKLVTEEEARIDEFIKEYSPSNVEYTYLLCNRDFHNAKALVKAKILNVEADRMLAPQGLMEIEKIRSAVASGDIKTLQEENEILADAIAQALALEDEASGVKIGEIFENALYSYLYETVKRKSILRNLLIAKADMTNILTAIRSENQETAQTKYLKIGSLQNKTLDSLFLDDREKAESAFKGTPYESFVKKCLDAKAKGVPPTEAEKIRDGYDAVFFEQRKYELIKNEPFLYYVYRRRLESANVRIIFVCLLAGLSETDVKKRLRAW